MKWGKNNKRSQSKTPTDEQKVVHDLLMENYDLEK